MNAARVWFLFGWWQCEWMQCGWDVCVCVCVGVRLNGMLMDGKDISSPSVSSQMTFLHVADPQIRTLTRAVESLYAARCMLIYRCGPWFQVHTDLSVCFRMEQWKHVDLCLLQTQMNASFLKTRSAKTAFVSIPLVGMSVTARLDSTMMRANYSVLVRSKITISM